MSTYFSVVLAILFKLNLNMKAYIDILDISVLSNLCQKKLTVLHKAQYSTLPRLFFNESDCHPTSGTNLTSAFVAKWDQQSGASFQYLEESLPRSVTAV